jgi:hypothetical protein
MSNDLPELTPEQMAAFHRAAANLKDEDFAPEDLTAIRRGWLGLVKEKSYSHPGWHYEMAVLKNHPPRGSFRLDRNTIAALGHGDLKAGAAVAAGMFSIAPGDDPTIVHPDVVRDIGHCSLAAGRRVLERFVARVRRQSRDGGVLQHDARRR